MCLYFLNEFSMIGVETTLPEDKQTAHPDLQHWK